MDKILFQEKVKLAVHTIRQALPFRHEYKLSVKKVDEGKTLLNFYTEKFNRETSTFWLNKIESGEITVNGQSVSHNHLLQSGELSSRTEMIASEPEISDKIQLLYEDDDLIIIDKPSPLPCDASGRFVKSNLKTILELIYHPEPIYPIHRIDANTTGIVLFAKNKKIASNLIDQFKNFGINKTYVAIVDGLMTEDGHISSDISKVKDTSGSRKNKAGESSLTNYKIVSKHQDFTFLEIEPKTGKTNQIRIHLASVGHPIIGDLGYQDNNYFKENPLTYPDDCLFLHAWKISLKHPRTNLDINFESPLPLKFIEKLSENII